jgi:large subunit ribosomal protein L25
MNNAVLKIEPRKALGGGKVKRLRANGYVPAVVYGKEVDATPLAIKVSNLRESLVKNGKNAVFNIELENGKLYPVVIKEIQYDILKNGYQHVDLQQVSLTEKRKASVPVRLVGSSEGILVHQIDEIEVECLPLETPEYIEADISHLTVGSNLVAGDLKMPENVTLLSDPENVIASITEVKQIADEGEDEGGETETADDGA